MAPEKRDSPPSFITIKGAKEHNLKNLSLRLPHHQFIVITGVSGSGKSSLVFDTIYIEGHRRYMETLESNYVRQFIQTQPRPKVDQIQGLPPVIGIRQSNQVSKNSRSTVGTSTEIYAFLRLLFAKIGVAYSYVSGKPMYQQRPSAIVKQLKEQYASKAIRIFAPIIKGRKGHYEQLFQKLSKQYTHLRVDNVLYPAGSIQRVDRYKNHDIEVLIEQINLTNSKDTALKQAVDRALKIGKGALLVQEIDTNKLTYFSTYLMDPISGISYPLPSPNTFSFNSPYGACPLCHGLGTIRWVDHQLLVEDTTKGLFSGGLPLLKGKKKHPLFRAVAASLQEAGYDPNTPYDDLPDSLKEILFYGKNHQKNLETLSKESVIGFLYQHNLYKKIEAFEELIENHTCPACAGTRIKKEARYFKIDQLHIAQLAEMNLTTLMAWLDQLRKKLTPRNYLIVKNLLDEAQKRLRILVQIGLDYLCLNRPLSSLSGGELQRIRLGTQIGTQLVGVLYILDEPSIGLHARDNAHILNALRALQKKGNTVLVIEHDKDTMLAADYLMEIGPKAGKQGGEIVAEGSPDLFLKQPSVTADYLVEKKYIPYPQKRRKGLGKQLVLSGCSGHNLKNVRLNIPLGKLVCITGVSGSGKSSLAEGTLLAAVRKALNLKSTRALPYEALTGIKHIDKVIAIDQQPIGRTPRSNPATYTGLFNHIRRLYCQVPMAKARGYQIGQFSFNVRGGRCESCKGAGLKLVEMDFLPRLRVPCATCQSKRYNRETQEITYQNASIADVLQMQIGQAHAFFKSFPAIQRKTQALIDVGLDYITLGQHATTLSGGEAQRIKLASELAKKSTGKTLYLLNEPSTGLHFQDIAILLSALNRLVDQGNTVVIIEHNMDIIKVADHIIDLGPEGGNKGGYVVAEGTPEELVAHQQKNSYTAQFLNKILVRKAGL